MEPKAPDWGGIQKPCQERTDLGTSESPRPWEALLQPLFLERPGCHSPGLCIVRSRIGPAAVLRRRGEHRSGQGSNTLLPKGGVRGPTGQI